MSKRIRIGSRGAWLAVAAAASCLGVGSVPIAHSQTTGFSLRAGIEHSTGDYGGMEELDDVYVPLTLLFEGERLALRVMIPYVEVEFADPVATDGSSTYTESGLGDIIVDLTAYDVARSADGTVVVDLTGKIKLPTADDAKGLSTGEVDYSLQADVYKFFGSGSLVGTLGYRVRGEPESYSLEDTWLVSVGGLYRLSAATNGGVFLDYRASSIPGAPSLLEASVLVSHRFADDWRLQAYLLRGLSETSLDWGGGLSVQRGF